jgi:hypothetical protein
VSTRTPPGWYPDPGHAGFGPAPERWWDGEAWSEHIRAAAPGLQPGPPHPQGFPQYPGPAQVPPPRKPRGPLIAGIVGSVAVVLALVVGVVVVTRDDGGRNQADDGPTPTASAESTAPDDDASQAPAPRQLELAHGVKLPLLAGWERVRGTDGAAVNTTRYSCPLQDETCVRAGASVHVTPTDGDAETVAGADIEANATHSYGERFYGGITSHEVTESKAVRVAGQNGYLVRWKIDNEADPDAYVQSVAFPHPDESGQMLVLRIGFDVHDEAPPVGDMDKLVAGVEEGAVLDDSDSEAV